MELTEETGVNKPREFKLTQDEKQRLIKGIKAFYILGEGEINGHHWEDLFSYVKAIPRVKNGMQLYDIVDPTKRIGWSAKTKGVRGDKITPGDVIEVVIQRSDILSYSKELSKDSPVEELGEALLKNWNLEKVAKNMSSQNVDDSRICILLKSKDRTQFAYYECELETYAYDEIEWKWADETKMRLVGTRKADGFVKYGWNPNQGHFYEELLLPKDLEIISIGVEVLNTEALIEKILKPDFKQSLVFWYKNIVGRFSSFMNTTTAKAAAA